MRRAAPRRAAPRRLIQQLYLKLMPFLSLTNLLSIFQ
jgi:hypothetical protein